VSSTPPVVARVGVYVWPNMTMLDCLAPHQALGICPGLEVFTFARTTEPLVTDSGLTIVPDHSFDDVAACDVLLVGGGADTTTEMNDPQVTATLARLGAGARWVTAVCTGSLILAAAGLLDGYRANTHWTAREVLAGFPDVELADGRVVVDGNRVTGGGVTAGLDIALTLIGLLTDDATGAFMGLVMEYDPAPPYGCGHPDRAPAELVAAVRSMS
jgi:cyclohexyl-isocyanide hydratase